jgi:hypothetical protein
MSLLSPQVRLGEREREREEKSREEKQKTVAQTLNIMLQLKYRTITCKLKKH